MQAGADERISAITVLHLKHIWYFTAATLFVGFA